MKTIEMLRQEYDDIDAQLVKLLEARFMLSEEMRALKARGGLDFYDPTREAQVLDQLKNVLKVPKYFPLIQAIYQRIFEVSKQIQRNTND